MERSGNESVRIFYLSWFQLVVLAQRTGLLPVLARANQFGDLSDVARVVHRPLVEHLLQRDLTGGFVMRVAFAGAARQRPQISTLISRCSSK